MLSFRIIAIAFTLTLLGGIAHADAGDVIDLSGSRKSPVASSTPQPSDALGVRRETFDYRAFESRLEGLWFQRKAFVASGRYDDARRVSDAIVAIANEEGIDGLPNVSGALLSEARRAMRRGDVQQADAALDLAVQLDRGRPQLHLARAQLARRGNGGFAEVTVEVGRALRAQLASSLRDLGFINRSTLLIVLACGAGIFAFATTMALRHGRTVRHDAVRWFEAWTSTAVARVLAWAMLLAPLLTWWTIGWSAFYWIVITFRYMHRRERIVAIAALVAALLLMPAYEMSVALYSMTADPQVHAAVNSADRQYDPDGILTLRRLVEASPDDPVYRFLLAGLYKGGRYYDEAFREYQTALEIDPDLHQAHINLGNIFFTTGQLGEASTAYTRALQAEPNSAMAYFNLHLVQSQLLRFSDAEAALERARQLAPEEVASWMTDVTGGTQPQAQDATLQVASVWRAALMGRMPRETLRGRTPGATAGPLAALLNPIGAMSLLALIGCGIVAAFFSSPGRAHECVRCGDPYSPRPSAPQDAIGYCIQCYHLFVRGEGLAPGAKQAKLFEVRKFETRRVRLARLANALLPGRDTRCVVVRVGASA